ncbi:MAG: hypothetical protein GWP10_19950 [Nitrospiraceae bacterium]|nr:hypothetical protein [Nitrospiraceae bacterium]
MGTIKHLWMDYRIFLPKYMVVIETPVVASVCFTVEFYHMTEELFRDAIYFKEQAENLSDDPNNNPKRRRYSRVSIILSFSTIECFINEFIIKSLSDPTNPNITPSAKRFLNKRLSPREKITLGVELITGEQVDISNSAYNGFNHLIQWRNSLVHIEEYKNMHRVNATLPKNKKNEDIATVYNAKKGIETVRAIIKEIHKLDGTDYPRFIDVIQ